MVNPNDHTDQLENTSDRIDIQTHAGNSCR